MNNLPNGKIRRILVIDDNRGIHDDFRKILSPDTAVAAALRAAESALFDGPVNVFRKTEYEIDSAYQGQEGVMMVQRALAEGRSYALAFVDIRMPPGMDGVETTQKIWAVDPAVQIVLCTAYADYSWDEMFEKIGHADGLVILKKPFDTVEVLQLAQALTEKWRLHQQSRQKMEALERMVAGRTRELQEANQALQLEVTEHERAEATLRESEERFAAAFAYAPIGVALVSPAGRFLKVNQALCDLIGYSADALLTHTFQDLTHPEDLDRDLELVQRMLAGEIRSYQMEKRYVHERGHLVTALLNVSLVRDAQGAPRYFISQIQDITERERVAAALLDSRALYHSLVEHLAAGIFRKDAEGRYVFVNSRFCDLKGMKADDILGKTPGELSLHEASALASGSPAVGGGQQRTLVVQGTNDHELIMRTGAPVVGEEFYVQPDGTTQYFQTFKSPVFTADGKLIGTQGIQFDITQRKQAEEALRASDEKFHQLADNVTDAFWIRSPDLSAVHYISPAFERIWGRPVEYLYEHPEQWSDFILPEDRERVRAAFGELVGNAPSLDLEYRIVRPDGGIRWVHVRGFQVRDAAGKLVRHAGIVSDITERKKAESAAAAFSRLSRELSFVASPEEAARIISEAALTVLEWDAFAIQLYSVETDLMTAVFDVDTFDGKRIQGPPRSAHKPSKVQRRILDSGAELILREQPGAFLPGTIPFGNPGRASASLLFVPVHFQARKVGILSAQSYTLNAYDRQDLRMLQTLADLCGGALERIRVNEALRKSEAQMFQSQKLETVGKLAGGIAQEFNSILTVIIGECEFLLADLPPGSPLAGNATGISQAAVRAATLTQQLLAYGRKQFLQPEDLDLNHVLNGMAEMFRILLASDVDTKIVSAPGLKMVRADAGQVEQVIMNMVINARESMPNGGKLMLETANVTLDQDYIGRFPEFEVKPGEYVMLAITDTGIGMSEAAKARLFEPFYSTKVVGKGSGLGLSTCYGIVKQSGGHISVDSEPGRGTTFKIYLPQVDSPVQPPGSTDLPRGTETILLVENDSGLREMAAALLKRLGYEVWSAANEVEAWSVLQQRGAGHIDLLVTDVAVPHMSGKELAERVRALSPQIKILFTSAYSENSIVQQGVLAKGVAVLQKPFMPSALACKLRDVLDQPVKT